MNPLSIANNPHNFKTLPTYNAHVMNTILQGSAAKIFVMAQPTTTFMTLPPEIRERVYEYIALRHTTRRIRIINSESVSVTTSAIAATCRLIFDEYEDVARKTTTALEFTAIDMDLNHIIEYFHRYVDTQYLAILQLNEATIHVNMAIRNSFRIDMVEFYTWALFLIGIKLEVAYHGDPTTWMAIYEATPDPSLPEQCVIEENSPQIVRDNIEEFRSIAEAFNKAVWAAYPYFFEELQDKRHQEFNRHFGLPASGRRRRKKPSNVNGVTTR